MPACLLPCFLLWRSWIHPLNKLLAGGSKLSQEKPRFLQWPPGSTLENGEVQESMSQIRSAFRELAKSCRYGSLPHAVLQRLDALHLNTALLWGQVFSSFSLFGPPASLSLWPTSSLWFLLWEGLVRSLNGITLKNSGPGLLVPFSVAVLPPTKNKLSSVRVFWLIVPDHNPSRQGSHGDRNLGRGSRCIHSREAESKESMLLLTSPPYI